MAADLHFPQTTVSCQVRIAFKTMVPQVRVRSVHANWER